MNTVSANMKLKSECSPVSRRRFLGVTATAIAGFSIVPRHVLGGPKFVPPSEKVNIAIVGCGGQGRTNVRALFNEADAQIIAVADPIESFSLEGFYYKGLGGRKPVTAEIEKHYSEKTPNYRVAEYEDFRVMLEKEKSIDAVLCATPDHNHAYVTVTAMRLGKHVYCEKPLTHNIWEARFVAKVAKETGVATQMGNHGHSGEGIRQTVEWLQDGAIGQVREVHAWTRTGRWNKESPKPMPAPVPAGVNWDLWIGTREMRPYSPNYTPVTWRDYWAFGSAVIGDMSPHHLDAALWALDLAAPESVEACSAVPGDDDIAPVSSIIRYRFGRRGTLPPLAVSWFDAGLMPPRPDELEDDEEMGQSGNGTIFIGDKGKMMCAGWGGPPRLLPFSRMETYQRPAKTIPRAKGHHRDWLDAAKGGSPASSNFEYGARLTELVLLGKLALRINKKLQWDSANLKVKNAPEAEQFIKGSYRKGWEVA